MLIAEHAWILSLLRRSLQVPAEAVPAPSELKTVETILWRGGILPTVYPFLPPELQGALQSRYLAAVRLSVQQDYEGGRVLKALSDAGFDCIALKGWELRGLYPKPALRQMADMDILVRPYRGPAIRKVMEELGYSGGKQGGWKHDSFRRGDVHIEAHKRLTDDSDAIQAWEKSVWDRAERAEDNIYKLSPEDFLIFHFVHLHKDFMNGSLGARRIVDTWLLQKEPVDAALVRKRLEEFGIWTFHERMVRLSRAAMGEAPMDEGSELLLRHAFAYGIYGSDKSYKVGRIAAMGGSVRSGKRKSRLAAVFLPYKRMKAQYPILEKAPILLPFCWLKRILRFLKGDVRKNRRRLDYSNVSEEDYAEMKRFFEAGGV